MKPRKKQNKTRKIFYQKPIPLDANSYDRRSEEFGRDVVSDVGLAKPEETSHTEIYVSPDGRSMTEITEQKQVGPGRISYSIQESSVYRNIPFLPVKIGKKTRRKKHHPRKKNRS